MREMKWSTNITSNHRGGKCYLEKRSVAALVVAEKSSVIRRVRFEFACVHRNKTYILAMNHEIIASQAQKGTPKNARMLFEAEIKMCAWWGEHARMQECTHARIPMVEVVTSGTALDGQQQVPR